MSLPTSVASLVFLDLETTSIPKLENNRTKITEISLVAVKRRDFLDCDHGETPRFQHKLTLCVNPGRLIDPGCTRTTGLSNNLLENESRFDAQVFDTLNHFLSTLEKPICFLAHNGLCHDYPILRASLEKILKRFSDDLLCADTLQAYRDIFNDLEALDKLVNDVNDEQIADANKVIEVVLTPNTISEFDEELCAGTLQAYRDTLNDLEGLDKLDNDTKKDEQIAEASNVIEVLTPNVVSEFDEEYNSKNEHGIKDDILQNKIIYESEFNKEFNIENNTLEHVELTQNVLNEFCKEFSTQGKESNKAKDEIQQLTPNTLLEFCDQLTVADSNDAECETTLNLINKSETTPTKSSASVPETPKKRARPSELKLQRNAKRRLNFSEKKGMRLCKIYKKLLNKPAVGCHHAENDCIINLEAALAIKEEFVHWVDNNCCVFNDIEPMRLGVRLD